MEAMFNECHKLKEIKGINNFDLTNVKNKNNIFNPLSSPDIVPPKDKVVTCVGVWALLGEPRGLMDVII